MTYIPVWKRSPNKFIRYEDRSFTLPPNAYGIVKHGVETVAVFNDKKGNQQKMEAFVKWIDK